MALTIIMIVLSFWVLAKTSEANQRKRAAKRAEAERIRRQAEIDRIHAEQRKAKRERKEMIRWQLECDKEMSRLQREQEREEKARLRAEAEQQKINERLEKEQQKQAEELRKQQIRLLSLEQKIALADHDIEFYRPQVEEAEKEIRGLEAKVWYFSQRGLPCQGYRDKLEKKQKALHQIQTKLIKAEQQKTLAEKQMQAA